MKITKNFSLVHAVLLSFIIYLEATTQNANSTTKPTLKSTKNIATSAKTNSPVKNPQGGRIKVAVVTSKPNNPVNPIATKNSINTTTNTHKDDKSVATTLSPTKTEENLKNETTTQAPTKTSNKTTNNSHNDDKSGATTTKTKENLKNETTTIAPTKKARETLRSYPKRRMDLGSNTFCTCDLQKYVCDINCCCDPDCKEEDKNIFEYCEIDKNRYYDNSFCDYARHLYINNTPYQWLINQEGIFCVIKSNQPKSFLLQKKKAFKSFKAAEMEKSDQAFWNEIGQSELNDNFKTVAFGDPVWILEKDGTYRTLALPKSFYTSTCIYQEDILYLKEMKSSCSQINADDENQFLNLASYVKDKKVIAQPQFLNNITKSSGFNGSLYQACPKTLCLPIDVYICNPSFKDCKHLNTTSNMFNCSFDIRKNLMSCFNALEKLQYTLMHNGTTGLVNVEVKAVLKNFSFQFGNGDFAFNQEFSVNYRWVGQRENFSEVLSGNPGYLIGKPILIGMFTVIDNNSIIVRNSSKFADNFLTLPGIEEGNCVHDEDKLTPVEFGYNLLTKCHFVKRIDVMMKNSTSNANKSCQIIQKNILEALRIPITVNKTLGVGLFGNANSQNKEDWNEFLFEKNPLEFVNMTYGHFTNLNKTLKCFGILTSISIDVLHSRVDFEDLLNQNKILALEYKFNSRNQSFNLKNNVSIDLNFVLHSKVEFFDVTGEKKRKFVGAPSLKIQLPYDFFYPFIKVDNSSYGIKGNSFISIVFLCLSIVWIS